VPQSDAELGDFLLRACHELRGPLRAILAHSELLAQGGEKEQSASLGFVINGAVQAGLSIDGVTEYCLALQIDRGTFQPVPMDLTLRAALAKLAAGLREIGGEVRYDTLPKVWGNLDRLIQLFEYLVDYGIRNRGAEALRIHVTAECRPNDWLFQVRDNGRGLQGRSLERAFRPFERLFDRQRPGPGLATCRVIVERHGGSMWAESPAGGGTTFFFTLPLEE
jgi:light-regulated signal transduction histidine kinase (bacteriophytochrome)